MPTYALNVRCQAVADRTNQMVCFEHSFSVMYLSSSSSDGPSYFRASARRPDKPLQTASRATDCALRAPYLIRLQLNGWR